MTQGKGSTPRPKAVPEDTYAENWTRTFCPPLRDPVDSRELMRRRNLDHARRIVLGIRDLAAQAEARATRCHDYPTDP
jgi:hypothetical protein